MNIRKKNLNVLSTAFLAISLIVAGGIATDTLNPRDVEANANVQNDLEICSTTLPPYLLRRIFCQLLLPDCDHT